MRIRLSVVVEIPALFSAIVRSMSNEMLRDTFVAGLQSKVPASFVVTNHDVEILDDAGAAGRLGRSN